MAKFTQKPPVVDALQFTGGQASATAILEGMAIVAPEWSIRFLPASSEFGMVGGVVTETQYTERLRMFNTHGAELLMVVGDWVLVDTDKTVKVLPNADFIARFQAV